jgi:hypothetical protein
MLSRNQMEQVIRSGGSVLHGGRILTKPEHLPTDADLAVGNPEQEALAAAALEAQIAALQAQHDRLTQSRMPKTGTVAPSPESPPTLQGTVQPPPALADTVGQELADRLAAAGYGTPEAAAAASDEQLRAVEGVGPKTIERLRAAYGGK